MADAIQQRVIGLVGGMSWESTALYYRHINELMQTACGAHHNAESVLYTVDFARLLAAGQAGRWDEVAATLVHATRRLAAAGAHCVLLTANTAHTVAAQVAADGGLPLLHIADATARAVRAAGGRCFGLVGTSHITRGAVYRDYLCEHYGYDILTPTDDESASLDQMIFGELTLGRLENESRERLVAICTNLVERGAHGVIVGCTELPLLLHGASLPFSIFDTTRLHARAAVHFALEKI